MYPIVTAEPKRNRAAGKRTHLYAPTLMMDIVKLRVLLAQPLEGIPRQLVPAMIVQALHRAQCDEPHSLPRAELRNGE